MRPRLARPGRCGGPELPPTWPVCGWPRGRRSQHWLCQSAAQAGLATGLLWLGAPGTWGWAVGFLLSVCLHRRRAPRGRGRSRSPAPPKQMTMGGDTGSLS